MYAPMDNPWNLQRQPGNKDQWSDIITGPL